MISFSSMVAVICMDLQNDYLTPGGHLASKHVQSVGEQERSISNLLSNFRYNPLLLSNTYSATTSDVPSVIWVKSLSLPTNSTSVSITPIARPSESKYALAPMNDSSLTRPIPSDCCVADSWGYQLHSDIQALVCPSDLVINKHSPSAFSGTSLASILASNNIRTVILCGLLSYTSILATAADAFFLGLDVIVPYECVGHNNMHKHMKAMHTISTWYGHVCHLESVIGKDLAHIYGAGDSRLVHNVMPPSLLNMNTTSTTTETHTGLFYALKHEVAWQEMFHRGGAVPRLVCVQGICDPATNNSIPIYRHPADTHPKFYPCTLVVDLIRRHISHLLGHELNHVLIQLYRDGKDYISEHSDKTLDVVAGTSIVNLSLGAERTMVLRSKRDTRHSTFHSELPTQSPLLTKPSRKTQRFNLPNNSLFIMGLKTNALWLHGIAQDKSNSALHSNTTDTLDSVLERISLTFRTIGTFITQDQKHIYGQGAKCKTFESAQPISFDLDEMQNMIDAFGAENQSTMFNWDQVYGRGFNTVDCASNVE
ncbi:hypothetical protein MT418_004619 [Batrachochytrium dendrobatidis]